MEKYSSLVLGIKYLRLSWLELHIWCDISRQSTYGIPTYVFFRLATRSWLMRTGRFRQKNLSHLPRPTPTLLKRCSYFHLCNFWCRAAQTKRFDFGDSIPIQHPVSANLFQGSVQGLGANTPPQLRFYICSHETRRMPRWCCSVWQVCSFVHGRYHGYYQGLGLDLWRHDTAPLDKCAKSRI